MGPGGTGIAEKSMKGLRMHELSVARNLVDLIRKEAPPGELPLVRTVNVRIGEFAGIVPESLEFCYTVLVEDTPLAASHLSFERIPFTIDCVRCGRSSRSPDGSLFCLHCKKPASSILTGLELELASIEVAAIESELAWQPSP